MTTAGTSNNALVLPRGTEVEVRTRYQGRWAGGFAIDEVHHDRYRLRRHSDGTVLPVVFRADELRPRR
jgi:hypothetical protein